MGIKTKAGKMSLSENESQTHWFHSLMGIKTNAGKMSPSENESKTHWVVLISDASESWSTHFLKSEERIKIETYYSLWR